MQKVDQAGAFLVLRSVLAVKLATAGFVLGEKPRNNRTKTSGVPTNEMCELRI